MLVHLRAKGRKNANPVPNPRKNSITSKTNYPFSNILSLHKAIGNQAVQRLIESGAVQTKLTVGKPNDIYEQEADRLAEQVMRAPEPYPDRQGVSEYGHVPSIHSETESQINSMKGSGRPLPESVRAFFEPRFRHNFSQVRVHTDSKATESAQTANALAYTIGHDIAFGTGQYAPDTQRGKRLLAHELAHVVQQTGIARRESVMRSPDKKGFDEKKMFEIARKSKKVVELEEKAKKLGFSYGGQVSGEHSYTDPAGKKIYIQKELSNEKAALDYGYELQNAVNASTKYKDIFDKAEKGEFKDASEYATAVLSVEVEALITEAEISIELGIKGQRAVENLVRKHKKGEIKLDELKKSVMKLAEAGVIDGMNARKYYEKQYKDVYGK